MTMNTTEIPLNDYEIQAIAVGKSEKKDTIAGNFFYIQHASHPRFRVQLNDGGIRGGAMARGHTFPEDVQIKRVRIYNDDPVLPLTVTVVVGRGTPIDNLFNINADEVTPTLRDEIPSLIAESVSQADVAGLNNWTLLLAADEFRESVVLWTDAAALAYWAPVNTAPESGARNIVPTSGLSGLLTIRNKSAIYVRHKEAGTQIRALAHKFA